MDVSVVPCSAYDLSQCRQALEQLLFPLGALDWVRPGMRVGLKANLITFLKPDAAGTTHPVVLSALSDLLTERGAEVIIGDSPGGLYTAAFVGRVYSAAGLHETEQHGAKLNQDFSQRDVEYPEGRICRRFPYTAWLDSVDAVINVCKLKTHGMMAMSCGAKNLFGVIPGHPQAGIPFPVFQPRGLRPDDH